MRDLRMLSGRGFELGARGLLAAALALAALGLGAAPASAATVTVNTTVDQATGSCATTCSLRDAVATANPGDTVQIPGGHYVLTLGDIVFAKSLTIVGAGARTTILDGNGASRIFQINDFSSTTDLEIDDVALVNGLATPPIFFLPSGGAVAFIGNSLTLRRCQIAGSSAFAGGGILVLANLATIDQCTITGNRATGNPNSSGGGAVLDGPGGTVTATITNSTVSGNVADFEGGGLVISGNFTLTNDTITANQASVGSGGGLSSTSGQLQLNDTIVGGNTGGDCQLLSGPPGSDHSLDSDGSCMLTSAGDLSGVDPLLGPLANNGGPTDTIALLAGSPAIDAGDNATCLATDQRGVTRPQGPNCDIGAYEVVVAVSPPPSCNPCNGTFIGACTGNLNVLAGQVCIFLGGSISGNVTQTGGSLKLSNTAVGNDVQVNGGGTFTIGPGTTIKGNLQIQHLPAGAAQNQVCATSIHGNLQFQNNQTAVLIGSGSGSSSCPGNTVGNDLQVSNNTGATTIDGNTVGGNLQDQNNIGATEVFNNAVKNNLQCQGNTSITGGGNTAAQKSGQCAGF